MQKASARKKFLYFGKKTFFLQKHARKGLTCNGKISYNSFVINFFKRGLLLWQKKEL